MSARRVDVQKLQKLQEMVRLHRLGRSHRAIARQLRMGRDTIRQYFEVFAGADLLEGPAEGLPDAEVLRQAIESSAGKPSPPKQQRSSVEDWRDVIAEMVTKGIGPTPIHDFLRLNEPTYDGSLSAVKRLCVRVRKELGPRPPDVAIPVETVAGEVAQVDFGYVGRIYDPERGVGRRWARRKPTQCYAVARAESCGARVRRY